jgi:ABC-2 type transport system permease protein
VELLGGFVLGGFIRGTIVSVISYAVAGALVGEPVTHALVLIPSLILVGLFFSLAGVLVGVRAEQFDDVALYQTFVLQPLIFLGGVFYSATSLGQPWGTLTHFDPVYYMIALVRYGFIGYHETSIWVSFVALFLGTVALFCLDLWIFTKGRYLRT